MEFECRYCGTMEEMSDLDRAACGNMCLRCLDSKVESYKTKQPLWMFVLLFISFLLFPFVLRCMCHG
jgi:hypothetical protein